MSSLLPHTVPRRLTDPIVSLLARLGVSPNLLTLAGVLGNVGAAVLVGAGHFLAGGIIMLSASALDLLDGALARATGQVSRFGSILDATMDRVSEAAVLFGLLVFFSGRGQREEVLLAAAALIGSFLVSYVRARAEVVGLPLPEGYFTRAARVLIIGIGLIVDQVTVTLWVMAVLTNLTAAQRLYLAWRKADGDPRSARRAQSAGDEGEPRDPA